LDYNRENKKKAFSGIAKKKKTYNIPKKKLKGAGKGGFRI